MNEREYELATLINSLQYDITKLKEELESKYHEPLSDNEIAKGYTTRLHMTQHAFYDGVKFAEKAHGIGGEE